MKKRLFLILMLILPLIVAAQVYVPGDFYGVIIYEKNRTIDFNYLNNPVCGTAISYFDHLPSTAEYNLDLKKNRIRFELINSIGFIKFTDEEKGLIRNLCPDCFIRKAKIILNDNAETIPSVVYVVLKQVDWKNTAEKDYEDLRTMEARFVNKITINVKK